MRFLISQKDYHFGMIADYNKKRVALLNMEECLRDQNWRIALEQVNISIAGHLEKLAQLAPGIPKMQNPPPPPPKTGARILQQAKAIAEAAGDDASVQLKVFTMALNALRDERDTTETVFEEWKNVVRPTTPPTEPKPFH